MVEIAADIGCMRLDNSRLHIHMRSIASGEFHSHRMDWKSMGIRIEFGACWHSRIVEPGFGEQHNYIATGLVVDSKSSEQQSNIDVSLCSPPPSHF